MVAVQEFDPQMLEVFCPNKRCGMERVNALRRVTILERVHREMVYVGSRTIGFLDRLVGHFSEYHFPESGTYHFYTCPVCGNQTVYLEKWGVLTRAYCG